MINKLIILAAGKGTRLRPVTNNIPKCLTPVGGKSILEWQIEVAQKCGIKEIIVVGGYKKEKIDFPNIKVLSNDFFETTNMVESLKCAAEEFNGGFILSYGDIIYEESVLKGMMNVKHDIVIAADMDWEEYWSERFEDPLSDAETFKFGKNDTVAELGQKPKNFDEIESQYIGLLSFSIDGSRTLKNWFSKNYVDKNMYLTDMLDMLIKNGEKVNAYKIYRGWLEIDNLKDLEIAESATRYDELGALKIIK